MTDLKRLIREVMQEEINKLIDKFYISGCNYERIADLITERIKDRDISVSRGCIVPDCARTADSEIYICSTHWEALISKIESKESDSQRIFLNRYSYNPILMEYLDEIENRFLCPDDIIELLNEGNELKLVYSCDINATRYCQEQEKKEQEIASRTLTLKEASNKISDYAAEMKENVRKKNEEEYDYLEKMSQFDFEPRKKEQEEGK